MMRLSNTGKLLQPAARLAPAAESPLDGLFARLKSGQMKASDLLMALKPGDIPPELFSALNKLVDVEFAEKAAARKVKDKINEQKEELRYKLLVILAVLRYINNGRMVANFTASAASIAKQGATGDLKGALAAADSLLKTVSKAAEVWQELEKAIGKMAAIVDLVPPVARGAMNAVVQVAKQAAQSADSIEGLQVVLDMVNSAIAIATEMQTERPGSVQFQRLVERLGDVVQGLAAMAKEKPGGDLADLKAFDPLNVEIIDPKKAIDAAAALIKDF